MAITKAERNRLTTHAKTITTAAYNNPNTRCCTCNRTLNQCGPNGDGHNANGTPCTWDAGHPDGRWHGAPLRAECSHCNRSRGATTGNTAREPRSRRWTA